MVEMINNPSHFIEGILRQIQTYPGVAIIQFITINLTLEGEGEEDGLIDTVDRSRENKYKYSVL